MICKQGQDKTLDTCLIAPSIKHEKAVLNDEGIMLVSNMMCKTFTQVVYQRMQPKESPCTVRRSVRTRKLSLDYILLFYFSTCIFLTLLYYINFSKIFINEYTFKSFFSQYRLGHEEFEVYYGHGTRQCSQCDKILTISWNFV